MVARQERAKIKTSPQSRYQRAREFTLVNSLVPEQWQWVHMWPAVHIYACHG